MTRPTNPFAPDEREANMLQTLSIWAYLTIFPLFGIRPDGHCACGKDHPKQAGKHPSLRWSTFAAGNKEIVPGGGYGIVTGRRSHGLVVIDIDVKGVDGYASLSALEDSDLGSLPETLEVETPSGGLHLYYWTPMAGEIANSASVLGPGIDVRGEGGMVVGPGSPHRHGGVYRIREQREVAQLPGRWEMHLRRLGGVGARAGSRGIPAPAQLLDFTPEPIGPHELREKIGRAWKGERGALAASVKAINGAMRFVRVRGGTLGAPPPDGQGVDEYVTALIWAIAGRGEVWRHGPSALAQWMEPARGILEYDDRCAGNGVYTADDMLKKWARACQKHAAQAASAHALLTTLLRGVR